MITRPMTRDDLAAVTRLTVQLGYPVTRAEIALRFAGIRGRDDHLLLVAVADDGEVAGWIHGYERHHLESAPAVEVAGLVIDDRVRSHGYGRSLMDAVEGWARSRGLAEIRLRSNVVRDGAHGFYEAIGYERVKTQHAFRKPLVESRQLAG